MKSALHNILIEHLDYHRALGERTRESNLNGEKKVVRDYRGRALVELFQNAIDRAASEVYIDLHDDILVVANDNLLAPLSVAPIDQAAVAGGRITRSDFHALCSIDTSQKKAWEAIGNKGIGFKSVFRECDPVELWSRYEGDWWGIRLRHPFTAAHAREIAARPPLWSGWTALWEGIATALARVDAPSFYFPEPLAPEDRPPQATDERVTVVVARSRNNNQLAGQLAAFSTMPLHFVSARYPKKIGVAVRVAGTSAPRRITFTDGWTPWPPTPRTRPDLVDAAEKEDMVFTAEHPPAVQLAIPPDARSHAGRFHCFFPTSVECGFGVDIHADFILDQARKDVEFEPRSDYNAALLDTAADLLIEAIEQMLHTRPDAWMFLFPSSKAHPQLAQRIADRLFEQGRWNDLAPKVFAHHTGTAPWRLYADFWSRLADWWGLHPRGTWDGYGADLLKPIRTNACPVLPIIDVAVEDHSDAPVRAVPLPGEERAVLLRREGGAAPRYSVATPDALLDRVSITWDFPAANRWIQKMAGIQKFGWDDVVVASRQWILPLEGNRRPRWSPDDSDYIAVLQERLAGLSAEDRRAVLRFWYLMALDASETIGPGERLVRRAKDRLLKDKLTADAITRRLRAEAALPLPVLGGGWLPACRVSTGTDPIWAKLAAETSGWGVLDRPQLSDLGVPLEEHDRLARRLGCFSAIPLLSDAEKPGLHFPFEPAPSALWSAVLPRLAESIRSDGPEVPFAASVRQAVWLPAGRVVVAPAAVWSVRPQDQQPYTHLPVIRESADPLLLRTLGIRRLPRRDEARPEPDDARAVAAICTLHQQDHPDDETRLLFARLVRLLDDTGAPVPILAARGAHPPEWLAERGGAWLVPPDHRALAAYFPDLPFACAEGSARLAARLGVRPFQPRRTVHSEGGVVPQPDEAMRERLAGAVPWLIAVSEHIRIGARPTVEEVAARWDQASICRAPNVYLSIALEGLKSPREVGRRKDGEPVLLDVFCSDDHTAWHDIPDAKRERYTGWLHRFAPWFALAVFGNERLTRPLSAVLEHLAADWEADEETRAPRHLRTQGISIERVAVLAERFDAARIEEVERAELDAQRRARLEDFGRVRADARLIIPRIGPEVFARVTDPEATEETVTTALRDLGSPYPVQFVCQRSNLRRFNRERPNLRAAVLTDHILGRTLSSWTDEEVETLWKDFDGFSPPPTALVRLAMSTETVLREQFPGRPAADADEERRAQAVLARRPYAELDTDAEIIEIPRRRTLGAGTVTPGERRSRQNQLNRLRGRKAEEARAKEAAERVRRWGASYQDRIDAERARIRQQVKNKTVLAPIDWAALDQDALAAALCIAREVDCGFDVLDIDPDSGVLLRVEVKSTQTRSGVIQVHLTANELLMALQTAKESGARFVLELYIGYDRRIDLSNVLQARLADPRLVAALQELSSLRPADFELTVLVKTP